jgi:hypothetical protein
MCILLRLVLKNITYEFFFASLEQRLSEMWEKKCDFIIGIKKPNNSSPPGKGYALHIQRRRKVLSNFETMMVKKKWVFSCIFSVCLVWLVWLMDL